MIPDTNSFKPGPWVLLHKEDSTLLLQLLDLLKRVEGLERRINKLEDCKM